MVREALEHFAATDEFLNALAPDFVWDMGTFGGWPDKPQFHGGEGLREFVNTRTYWVAGVTGTCSSVTSSWPTMGTVRAAPRRSPN